MVRNVVSNYLTFGWTAALSLATLPIYVRHLGSSEWGIVAACMTLQGLLTLMDVGFGQIMPRSFARIAGDRREEARLFAAYSRIFLVLAAVGFVVGQLAAASAARRWFHASDADVARLEAALRLVLVQFLFQFANNAHVGFWNGMEHQLEGNLRACAFMTLRHAGALALVLLLAPTAFGYLLPFVAGTILEWLTNRVAIARRYRDLDLTAPGLRSPEVRRIVRDAGAFSLAIVIGLGAAQADRLVLSWTQNLTQYGYYLIVANLGFAFMSLPAPIVRALFPRIAREDATGGGRADAFVTLLVAVLLTCVLPCTAVIVLAPEVLTLWLRDQVIVRAGTTPLRLILAAVAINALYAVIYQRMLAKGAGRVAIWINVATLLSMAGVVWGIGPGAGIMLGGAMWLALALTQLALGTAWMVASGRLAGAHVVGEHGR